MTRLTRVLALVAGLALTGVLAGGLAAACAIALTFALRGDWRTALDPQVWGFAAGTGAAIGGVVAPLTSFLFLRHVPLGALVLQTTLATILAGGVGFALSFNPFIAAPLGFAAAAARLAIVTPRNKSRRLPPDGRDQLGP